VASAAFKDGATSAILSGDFSITQNDITTKFVVPEGSTLQSLAKQINAQSTTTNISANIITDSNGSRLVLGSTVTGEGTEITAGGITGLTIGGGKLDTTDSTSSGYLGSIPKDAVFSIDGMEITSPTNAIKGALGGVSMTLLADNSTSTITVATNTDGLKTSLQSFVDSYNAVVKAIATVTKATVSDTPDPTTGATVTPAALTGDSMPRSILAAMRKELVTGAGGTELSVLSQLGINTGQTDGMLSLDATKFEKAMSTGNLGGQVQQLFSGTDSTNGLLSRMTAALNPYTETGGILDTRTSSLNKQSSDLQNQKTALDLRVATMTATLTAKYNAMDLLVGQLKASATSITSFFDTLNAQQSS
jgi:flagellar hook-associated protein 2